MPFILLFVLLAMIDFKKLEYFETFKFKDFMNPYSCFIKQNRLIIVTTCCVFWLIILRLLL